MFDAATGRPLRRLGDPLPKDRFQWATPIAVEPDGSSVVMQVYTVSGPPGVPGAGAAPAPDASAEYTFHTTRWDPVKKASLREWLVTGHRTDAVRRYAPYAVSLGVAEGDYSNKEKKLQPAKVRCYSLADGTLAHEALLTALAARKLSPAEVRELRAVQALEWQGTPAAREVLAEWARGDPAAALTRAARGAGR